MFFVLFSVLIWPQRKRHKMGVNCLQKRLGRGTLSRWLCLRGNSNVKFKGVHLNGEYDLHYISCFYRDAIQIESAQEPTPENRKRPKLEQRVVRLAKDVQHYKERSAKNRKEKNDLKMMYTCKIARKRAQFHLARGNLITKYEVQIRILKNGIKKYRNATSKLFSPKQVTLLLTGRKQAKWNNAEIGKFISLRYKSNLYEHMRSLSFPFASTRTLQRFTSKIQFRPGILHPIINMLKNEFESALDIQRQCCLVFDEMSLEGAFAYDAEEDKIYPPSVNMNVYFLRGLFSNWKQPIAFEFDDHFSPEKILQMIDLAESIGLRVRGLVCDLGGKNRGLLNKLGAKVRKTKSSTGDKYSIVSSFKNPTRCLDEIWVFPDAPHLIKLLRDNLFKYGLVLESGVKIILDDFRKLVSIDSGELQSNFKLSEKHINVKGLQKTTVSLAVQLFSNFTAALWRKIYPNRSKESDFIEIVNNWFDTMNSRTVQEAISSKKPFGINYAQQLETLEKMEESIVKLRVGQAKCLYPFQRGFLQSINSIRGLFHDMSGSSLRIKYILTCKVNQDLAENSFSMIRKTGAYHSRPSAVDAKRRLKLLCLSWGGTNLKTSAVQVEDNEPFLSARMMASLTTAMPEDDLVVPWLDLNEAVGNLLSEDNFDVVLRSMGPAQSCEEGGKEYVAGFVASKFARDHPELVASSQEQQLLQNFSWVMSLHKEKLTIPSIKWRNWCAQLEEEFRDFHRVGGRYHLSLDSGVLEGFSVSLSEKYPQIPRGPLKLFIKTRTFARIKSVNQKLVEERRVAAQKRMEGWVRSQSRGPQTGHEEDYDEDDNFFEEEDNFPEDFDYQVPNVSSSINWQEEYQNYINSEV